MQDTGLKGTDYVARAFGFVLDDISRVLQGAIVWSAPLVALSMWPILSPDSFAARTQAALFEFAATGNLHVGPTAAQWLFLLGSFLLEMVLIAGFAAQRHQQVLGRALPIRRSVTEAIGPYVGYWLMMALGAMLIGMLAGIPLSIVAQSPAAMLVPFLQLGLLAGIGMLILRSSLVFPAISIGDPDMTVKLSMEMTSVSIWRMTLAVILIAIPLILAQLALNYLLGLTAGSFGRPATELWGFSLASIVVTMLLQFIGIALFTAYLSLIYAHKRLGTAPVPQPWHEN